MEATLELIGVFGKINVFYFLLGIYICQLIRLMHELIWINTWTREVTKEVLLWLIPFLMDTTYLIIIIKNKLHEKRNK